MTLSAGTGGVAGSHLPISPRAGHWKRRDGDGFSQLPKCGPGIGAVLTCGPGAGLHWEDAGTIRGPAGTPKRAGSGPQVGVCEPLV
ncbi:hypothetical protein IscW_ISCW003109 [Ixodes scapularis]|uniref:Uncharacterized protein n=1 Tax=Ixodes scapularis TaxID=6945 RepID=B7PBE0_IXOSC|nr:hypothetical protein IscW_ISCW003109 [Ixodes scapularis]|eukprot:XP_002407992.1 hypothetical protein IscW_ISCW003109 [Ixodes scapularis]